MNNTSESNPTTFKNLLENYNVCIPIIQRDYALGREDANIGTVRKILIKDIIHCLSSDNKESKIDFNYIYGTTEEKKGEVPKFYPIDGQQRLTTLFLVSWYLAVASDTLKEFGKLHSFTYQTRNSAEEFFQQLKKACEIPDKSEGAPNKTMLEIVRSEDPNLKDNIQNSVWFRSNWTNDPTIQSALTVLDDLHKEGLYEFEHEKLKEMYQNLMGDNNRIFFQLKILEPNDSENTAAKIYLRMNACGMPLTDFENLKAMLDSIDDTLNLNHSSFSGIAQKYDADFIDQLFKEENTEDLSEKTKNINQKSFYFFYNVFNICKLSLSLTTEPIPDHDYISEIHNMSREPLQEKTECSFYQKYLRMLAKLFDFYCAFKNYEDKKHNKTEHIEIEIINCAFDNLFQKKQTDSKHLVKSSAVALCTFYTNIQYSNNRTDEKSIEITKELVHRCALMSYVVENLHINKIPCIDKLSHEQSQPGRKDIFEYFTQCNPFNNESLEEICKNYDIKVNIMKEQWIKAKIIREFSDNDVNDYYFQGLEERHPERRVQFLLYTSGYWECDYNVDTKTAQEYYETLKKHYEIAQNYFCSCKEDHSLEWKKLWAVAHYVKKENEPESLLACEKSIDTFCSRYRPWDDSFYTWDENTIPEELRLIQTVYVNKYCLNQIINGSLQEQNSWLKHAVNNNILDKKLVYCEDKEEVYTNDKNKNVLFDQYILKNILKKIKDTQYGLPLFHRKNDTLFKYKERDGTNTKITIILGEEANLILSAQNASDFSEENCIHTIDGDTYTIYKRNCKYCYTVYKVILSSCSEWEEMEEDFEKMSDFIKSSKVIIGNWWLAGGKKNSNKFEIGIKPDNDLEFLFDEQNPDQFKEKRAFEREKNSNRFMYTIKKIIEKKLVEKDDIICQIIPENFDKQNRDIRYPDK